MSDKLKFVVCYPKSPVEHGGLDPHSRQTKVYRTFLLSLKNSCINSRHSFSRTPDTISMRWFKKSVSQILKRDFTAPARPSSAPSTSRLILACIKAPADIAQGSIVEKTSVSVKR